MAVAYETPDAPEIRDHGPPRRAAGGSHPTVRPPPFPHLTGPPSPLLSFHVPTHFASRWGFPAAAPGAGEQPAQISPGALLPVRDFPDPHLFPGFYLGREVS